MSRKWITKYPLIFYFIFAYSITWILIFPLVLTGLGILSVDINWHFLGALGPTISAILIAYISERKAGIKKLKEKCFQWKIGLFWILFSIGIMPAFLILAILLNLIMTGNLIDLGAYLYNSGITNPLAFFLWLWVGAISYGLFEEIGWRGYTLPKLQEKHNALISTIILTICWAFWHVPMFFYRLSPEMVFGWFFGLFVGALLLTFIYNSTGGSAFGAILFHISNNFCWLFNIAEIQMFLTIMLTTLAIIILIKWKSQLSTKKTTNSASEY